MNNEWRFASNNNTGYVGLNDAGIETFSKNTNEAVVREALQNSLDAFDSNSGDQVKVTFALEHIKTKDIPDYCNLYSAMERCLKAGKQHEKPEEIAYFQHALDVLKQPTIPVLRISDENTKGLLGSEDPYNQTTNWFGLIKQEGSSNNKGQDAGGSFGIGKNAYFGVSDLRTVLFSSFNQNNHQSHIGITKLISFEESPDRWTTGKGFYAQPKALPIPGLLTLTESSPRQTPGTDIYILGALGFKDEADFKTQMIEYVLKNFFVSIWRNKLSVTIQDEEINQATLEIFMRKRLNSTKNNSYLQEYYELITSPKQLDYYVLKLGDTKAGQAFAKTYGYELDECTLYFKKVNEGKANRKVLMTRENGMSLFEQNRISGQVQFTGVMMITGRKMNGDFRKMEVPAHDQWEPGRCKKEEKHYAQLLSDFKRYLTTVIKDKTAEDLGDEVSVLGINKFLETLNGAQLAKKNDEGGFQKGTTKPKKKPKDQPQPHESQEKKSTEKLVPVTEEMFFGVDPSGGQFIYSFTAPKNLKEVRLRFRIVGEHSYEKVNILDAKLVNNSGKYEITDWVDNQVTIKNLKRNEEVTIALNLNYQRDCLLGVAHYEDK